MLLFQPVNFVIKLLVINYMTTSTSLAKLTNTHNVTTNAVNGKYTDRHQHQQQPQVTHEDAYIKLSTSADDRDPIKQLRCPIESIVTPRNDVDSEASINQLLEHIDVSWYKDKEPFRRKNGNWYDADLDKLKLILYQLGDSDGGNYECHIDYSKVPPNVANKFKFFKRGAIILLEVVITDPYIAPIITDPPTEQYVEEGANVTLKCLRRETHQPQTTVWFRGCMLPNESQPCDPDLDIAMRSAHQSKSLDPLVPFIIDPNNQDLLIINNVTEENIGFYGCAVHNDLGVDTRKVVVNLVKNHPLHARAQPSLSHEPLNYHWLWYIPVIIAFNLLAGGLICAYNSRMRPGKKQTSPLLSIDGITDKDTPRRRRLPDVEAPDIYNTGKAYDGFISGHFHQDVGHIFSQSMCANLLNNKASPSISSSNSHNSDEASSSWGKSSAHHGDNCRAIYSQSSNSTATTVPLYDHPPSTGTMRRCRTFVDDVCVSNPSYGLLNPDNDTTEWNFPRRNLERLDKIGEGQFGEVWRYIARSKDGTGSTVAVKRLKDNIYTSDCERSELRAEIEIMKSVNKHPNVIKLLHCCIDGCGPMLLIMEYAENGKLQTYLRNCRASRNSYPDRRNVTSKELIKFTYHIAKGMEYVASQGIVHRDLASRNILVSRENVCKVADFGFARRVDDDCAYVRKSTNPVPVKWMAPEALEGNKFTHKSDVFSLGILMWEIVTLGATPYEQLTSESVYKKVTTGGRLDRPPHCKDEFYVLMAECWTHDPALRPTFTDVALRLEKLLLSENDYIELDQYPEHAYYNIVNAAEKEVVQI